MATWYKIYWQTSTGDKRTVLSRNPSSAQTDIMKRGGRVYRVAHRGGAYGSGKTVIERGKKGAVKHGMRRKIIAVGEEMGDASVGYKFPSKRKKGTRTHLGQDKKDTGKFGFDKKTGTVKIEPTTDAGVLSYIEMQAGVKAGLKTGEQLHNIRETTEPYKEALGYQQTNWESIPIGERKYYYGGKRHLKGLSESKKKQFIEEYKEKYPDRKVLLKTVGQAGTFGGLVKEKITDKLIWEHITLRPYEFKEKYFEDLPSTSKYGIALRDAFVKGMLFPVTFPQAIVKMAMGGKTVILPDLDKALKKDFYIEGAPTGAISTGISMGMGGTREMERFKKDPLLGAYATIGEIAGLYVGSKGVGAVLSGLRTGAVSGTKYVVGKIPKYYYKTTLELGLPKHIRNVLYEGKIQNLWQRLHSYSIGEMKFVKVFKQKGLPKVDAVKIGFESEYKIQRIYKGFGRRELVPTNIYKLGKEKLLTQAGANIRGFITKKGVVTDVRFVFDIQSLKIKGILKKSITETYYARSFSTIKIGDISSGGFVNLTPVIGTMPKGYIPSVGFERATASISHIIKGSSIKPVGKDIFAQMMVMPQISITAPSLITKSGKIGHRALSNLMNIPAERISSLGMLSSSMMGTGYITKDLLEQKVVPRVEKKSAMRLGMRELSISGLRFDDLTIQRLELGSLQKQRQMQQVKLKMDTDLKLAMPSPSKPRGGGGLDLYMPPIKIRFPVVLLDGELKIGKKLGKEKIGELGYREREWQVGKIESMFNVGRLEKEMKKLMKGGKL